MHAPARLCFNKQQENQHVSYSPVTTQGVEVVTPSCPNPRAQLDLYLTHSCCALTQSLNIRLLCLSMCGCVFERDESLLVLPKQSTPIY